MDQNLRKVPNLSFKNAFDADYVPTDEEEDEVWNIKEELNVVDAETFEAETAHLVGLSSLVISCFLLVFRLLTWYDTTLFFANLRTLPLKNYLSTKCINDQWTPPKSTRGRNAVRAVLYPSNDEKQCVLLKRGPILLNRKKEQELFLFTTGILLINMDLDKLLDNSLAALKITGADNSFSPEKLKRRFEDLDKDGSGGEFLLWKYQFIAAITGNINYFHDHGLAYHAKLSLSFLQ